MIDSPSVEKMRQETVEDWVQVLMEREVFRKDRVSSGVRVRRLGVLGEVPWSQGKGCNESSKRSGAEFFV